MIEDALGEYSSAIDHAVNVREIRRKAMEAYQQEEDALFTRLKRKRRRRGQPCGEEEIERRVRRLRRRLNPLKRWWDLWQHLIWAVDLAETEARVTYQKVKDREYAYWSGRR